MFVHVSTSMSVSIYMFIPCITKEREKQLLFILMMTEDKITEYLQYLSSLK